MLSNPLHRFSPYSGLPTVNMMSTSHIPSSHLHGSAGLDSMAQGSQYALQMQPQMGVHQQHVRSSSPKHRAHPYNGVAGATVRNPNTNATGAPIRRRISRACDQCNQLRTKCDGQNPCARCIELGLGCKYDREKKKRGKASRKYIAAAAAAAPAAPAAAAVTEHKSPGSSLGGPSSGEASSSKHHHADDQELHARNLSTGASSGTGNKRASLAREQMKASLSVSMDTLAELPPHHDEALHADSVESPTGMGLNAYSPMPGYRASMNGHFLNGTDSTPTYSAVQHHMPAYTELPYGLQSPGPYSGAGSQFRMGESPMQGFAMK